MGKFVIFYDITRAERNRNLPIISIYHRLMLTSDIGKILLDWVCLIFNKIKSFGSCYLKGSHPSSTHSTAVDVADMSPKETIGVSIIEKQGACSTKQDGRDQYKTDRESDHGTNM